MRNSTVCKAYVDSLLSYPHGQSVSPQELQSILRFDITEHITDLGRFPLRLFEMMLDAGSNLLGDRHFGARAGVACSAEPWSLVSYLGMSAPNMREAINVAQHYSCLLIDLGSVELRELSNNKARLEWNTPLLRKPSQQVAEFFLASFYQTCKPLLDRHDCERSIYFPIDIRGTLARSAK